MVAKTHSTEEITEEIKVDNSMKPSVLFSGGQKGGVGKSFFSRILLDYFIKREWAKEFTFIEADPGINDISSAYKKDDCETIVFSDNKFDRSEPNKIIDKAEASKSVVVNLPSNISRQFDDWAQRIGLASEEIKKHCGDIVYFFVSDGCYYSIEQFLLQIKKYPLNNIPHVLVLNPGRRSCGGSFLYLEQDKDLMQAIKENEIPVIILPELEPIIQYMCDKTKKSYRELKNDETRSYADKKHLSDFLEKVDLLLLPIFSESLSPREGLKTLVENQKELREAGRLPK